MRRPSKSDSLRFLIASGLPVRTVLDVGVQDRTIELMECFPDTPHILFEPDTTQRETIHRNYERIDHVLVEAAVHHTSGFIEVAANGKVGSGLAGFRPTSGDSTVQIPAVALDTWLAENPVETPYFLKIDVDGGELDVLRGAARTLTNTSCVIIEAPMYHLHERLGALLAAGFMLWDIVDLGYYHDNLSQVDLVCINHATRAALPDLRPWETKEFHWQAWQNFDAG